jgi:uncharacterized membrane protein
MPYGINLYTIIILILIVLQWFKVGCVPAGAPGAVSPEGNLTNNGGLFIIALFILIACSCGKGFETGLMPSYSKCRCRR